MQVLLGEMPLHFCCPPGACPAQCPADPPWERRLGWEQREGKSGVRTLTPWPGGRKTAPPVPLGLTHQTLCPVNQPLSQTAGSASPSPTTAALGGSYGLGSARTGHPPWGLWLDTPQALTFDPIFLSMSSTRTFC